MDGLELIPQLIESLDKLVSQPTQPQLVNEAAALTNLIAKLLTADHNLPGQYHLRLQLGDYRFVLVCLCVVQNFYRNVTALPLGSNFYFIHYKFVHVVHTR